MSTMQLYIRFNLKLKQLNQKGLVPIRCRITFNKRRIDIATGLYVQSENWNISNQRFNAYLKEIADVTGITKNLTHHIARKTFATTVLLYNDVPMEIVSELLGHSKMATTQ